MKIVNWKLKINNGGFSLIEVIISAAVFAVVAVSIYNGYASLINLITVSRDKIVAIDLLNEQFEIVRNMPFANVGLTQGIPLGVLAATSTVVRDGRTFLVTRIIRNIDDPFDGTISGTPNDLSPADYKMVQISINCDFCKNFKNMTAIANVSPKNLETASTNGALFVKVFDANGVPIPQANVSIVNSLAGISINETTDNNALLAIVDAPPGSNAYRITATKSGYTTDRTYATSTGNPNPIKPDATVLLQQVTQISFIIDKVSTINVQTTNDICTVVPNVPFTVSGSKLIGTLPDVYKWSGAFTTDGSGQKTTNLEWDSYQISLGGGFYLAGANPVSPILILPNAVQNINLTISTNDPNFLLVEVKDSATGLPVSGASVRLFGGIYDTTLVTDRGYIRQTDWSGGSGQLNFIDKTRYHSSDGNIEINIPAGELKLLSSLGHYVVSGNLTSSVFDTGNASNWGQVFIYPTDQPPETGQSVKFQIATSIDNTATTTWTFLGPDGTVSSYYNILNANINPIHNGDRYIRYKIFLSTLDNNFTPNISDFIISFTSSCIPPGQVLFYNLNNGNYTLEINATGYQSQTIDPININSAWQKQAVLLLPQ